MTLAEIIKDNRQLFASQTWYKGEAFLDRSLTIVTVIPPVAVVWDARDALVSAGELAYAYVSKPSEKIWDRYLWTSDKDSLGQQVFMGVNNGKMEIHRHLHLTERFGVPTWS